MNFLNFFENFHAQEEKGTTLKREKGTLKREILAYFISNTKYGTTQPTKRKGKGTQSCKLNFFFWRLNTHEDFEYEVLRFYFFLENNLYKVSYLAILKKKICLKKKRFMLLKHLFTYYCFVSSCTLVIYSAP